MRRLLRRLLPVALPFGLVLAGCAPVDLLNATVPTSNVAITRDVAYGSLPRQALDIYCPAPPPGLAAAAAPAPVVVFFYGGSWDSGNRGEYLFVAASLARQGLVVMVPDYRLYPQVQWPVFLHDNAQAVMWAVHHAAEYGGDPGNVTLLGHSAGAYNVAMLALDPSLLAAAGGSRDQLAGVIGIAGPYDFLPMTDPEVQAVFAPGNDGPITQPVHYVDGHNPPMLLLAGTADHTVKPHNTTTLATRIRAAGGPVQDKLFPGMGHIGMVTAFAPIFRARAPVMADVLAFIRRPRQ